MNVEVTVIEIDVPAEGRGHHRQGEGMVDKLDEGVIQADEGEPVQLAAVWALAPPNRVDG
jgi:hypothetical protein